MPNTIKLMMFDFNTKYYNTNLVYLFCKILKLLFNKLFHEQDRQGSYLTIGKDQFQTTVFKRPCYLM